MLVFYVNALLVIFVLFVYLLVCSFVFNQSRNEASYLRGMRDSRASNSCMQPAEKDKLTFHVVALAHFRQGWLTCLYVSF